VSTDHIAQYRVLSRLGSGGMGEVFLADDTRLNRRVAIKRVRSDQAVAQGHRRLLTEAQTAARLDHPNICAIYEVGEDADGPFVVMPFVEGETLATRLARGPLPVQEAVSVAVQTADALAAAHARGILHRDIKPANIMIGARGQIRVMDFGLAKILDVPAGSEAAQTMTRLTQHGDVLGTVTHMSPEQARGEPLDVRSDLFSLGIVIYEMLAGRRPFGGASVAETLSAILTREPPPISALQPEVPDDLARIVAKLLRKDREERYQSAADVLVDLKAALRRAESPGAPASGSDVPPARAGSATRRRLLMVAALIVLQAGGWLLWQFSRGRDSTGGSERIASLAVLPLDSLSKDSSQDYVAAAMTEELTRALAGIKSLRVISRTSTEQYRGATNRNMREIARTLDVDGLIEGSVVRDGDRIRITAQLIHGPTDRHLWANAYDGDLRDMLALERRVAESIATEVRAAVTPDEQRALRTARSVDPRAMDRYLKARELFYAGTHAADQIGRQQVITQASAAFGDAIALQRDFGEAYAARAIALHWVGRFDEARDSALAALRIDDGLADAHGALGYVSAAYDDDPVTADREFRRATDLDPNSSETGAYAIFLSAMGRHGEARAMWERSYARDPSYRTSAIGLALDAQARELAGDYAGTVEVGRQLMAIAPSAAHRWMGLGLLFQGAAADAVKEFDQAGSGFDARADRAIALARARRQPEAFAAVRKLEESAVSPRDHRELAAVYANLGEPARAMDELERAFAGKDPWLLFINVDPRFNPIRGDPRFKDLLHRLGIPDAH
jgi:eukaryotic-like serine/threonine-protein kinase